MDQVVTNLVGNAIKYASGAPITVSIAASGLGTVELAVADRGPGIPEEDRERVFRQFERGEASNLPGMGLGLWIVQRIVAAHGGTATLDSHVREGQAPRGAASGPLAHRRQRAASPSPPGGG